MAKINVKQPYKSMELPKGEDKFPFGKYKERGYSYDEVPASYLLWFMQEYGDGAEWTRGFPQVLRYIEQWYARIVKDAEHENSQKAKRRWDNFDEEDYEDEY